MQKKLIWTLLLTPMLYAQTVVNVNSIPHFLYLPLHAQETDYTCGVAATRSVLHYYGIDMDESALSLELKPTPTDGTLTKEIVTYLRKLKFHVNVGQHRTLDQIHEAVEAKLPVIVLFQAWSEKPVEDWTTDWDDGHFAVVTGFDSKRLYFMDPSNHGKYTFLTNEDFLSRWHDIDGKKRVEQLAIIVRHDSPSYHYLPFDKIY